MATEKPKTETADNLSAYIDIAEKPQVKPESSFEAKEEAPKPADPATLELGVQCTVENISDINTSTQTFGCRIKFKICWEATPEDIESWNNGGKNDVNWVPRSFKPALTWPNAMDPPIVTHKDDYDRYYTCVDKSIIDGKLLVSYDFLAHGVFVEPFELYAFPFDTQDLRVELKLDHKSKNKKDPTKVSFRFVPSLAASDFIKFDLTNSVTTEWAVHPPIAEFGWTDPKESKKGHRYPLFQAKVKIERNTGFYLSRVCVTLALFSILSFTIFAIPADGVADRLAIMFTVLLTVIAYQLVCD